jgi:hypothetical protein
MICFEKGKSATKAVDCRRFRFVHSAVSSAFIADTFASDFDMAFSCSSVMVVILIYIVQRVILGFFGQFLLQSHIIKQLVYLVGHRHSEHTLQDVNGIGATLGDDALLSDEVFQGWLLVHYLLLGALAGYQVEHHDVVEKFFDLLFR